MRVRAHKAQRLVMVMAAAAVMLTGCQSSSDPGSTPVPSTTPESEPPVATGTYGPGEGRPMPTDGSNPETTASPSETPRPTNSTVVEVRIGDEDHSDLDWNVSCSGLESTPTVIASATDDALTEFVVVVVGSGADTLVSFTFTQTETAESARDRSGLTVNPGASQGNGSLLVEESTVTSTGRGVSYDQATVQPEADTTYAVEFACAG